MATLKEVQGQNYKLVVKNHITLLSEFTVCIFQKYANKKIDCYLLNRALIMDPAELSQIKWGQAHVVVIICPPT